MSVQAYQKTAAKTETPRQMEYRAFATATRGLIEAKGLPPTEIGRRAEALAKNRRLWSLLASDCAAPGNQLNPQLRAQIISLSLFVDRQSKEAIRDDDGMDILADINRTIMEGLTIAMQSEAAASGQSAPLPSGEHIG